MSSYVPKAKTGVIGEDGATFSGNGSPVSAPLVGSTRLLHAARVRRRVWTSTAALGFIAAVLLSTVFPPDYSTTTLVLLPHDPNRSDPGRTMETDVQLVRSRTVAQHAVTRARLGMPAHRLVSTYTAQPLSNDVLRIRTHAPTAGEAIRRARAVSEAFLELRREVLERNSQVAVAALEARREELTRELGRLNARIADAASAPSLGAPTTDVQGLTELLSRRAGVNAEEADLRRRRDDAIFGAKLLTDSSRIIDPATLDPRSPVTALAANVAAGTVAGLVLGVGWVLFQEVVSPRVQAGSEVTAVLGGGARILRSRGLTRVVRPRFLVRRLARRGRSGHGRLRSYRTRGVRALVADLRSRAQTDDGRRPTSLIVVSVESDSVTGVVVASAALELMAEGKKVLLVDVSGGSRLTSLLKTRKRKPRHVQLGGTEAVLWELALTLESRSGAGTSQPEFDRIRNEADVVLVFATVDNGDEIADLCPSSTEALAVVTVARTKLASLHWLSQTLRADGVHLAGVILLTARRRRGKTLALPLPVALPTPRSAWL